ncbi:uncharacterized protein HGUI_03128 [Hanseniaspora guilliermondii]|uniref:Uncharacterized protein n=1 Tax=Hanseniaspora guilliermondii TaxID=56406 RepID=A0A1L0B367_9ASCO|nr:uncharacterized protein HGUI_03128 [Hanseniaspora guilliermondii]
MNDIYEKYNINFTDIKYNIEQNEDVNVYDEFSLKKTTTVGKNNESINIINNSYDLNSFYKSNKKTTIKKSNQPSDDSAVDLKSEYFDVNKYLSTSKTTNLTIDNDLLKASINNNINQILVLKKNINSIFKSFDNVIHNDHQFNNILGKLNNAINDLSNYKNYKNNQMNQLVKFKNDFNKVTNNHNIVLLFTLPNIVFRLYELNLDNELIHLLILYLNYKNTINKPIIINKLDSEILKVLIKLKAKYYGNLDILNNINSLLLLNYHCNVINKFITDIDDEILNDRDVINYWMKLKLDKLVENIDKIDRVITFNEYGSNNSQDNENIIKRYCKNYYNFLLLDENHSNNVFNILNTSVMNNKHSNDFWKNWNNIITIMIPLLNDLKDFEFIITELRSDHLIDPVDDESYNIINTDSESLNNDYYKIVKFLTSDIYEKFDNKQIVIDADVDKDINIIKTNVIKKIISFSDSQLSLINSSSKYLNWVKSLTLFYADVLSIYEDISFDISSIQYNIINILNDLLNKDIANIFLLEDWIPLKAFKNMTISSVLFYKIIEFHSSILVSKFEYNNNDFIVDCIKILIDKYSHEDKELMILNNIESLINIECITLNKDAKSLLSDFKNATIDKYIKKDCLKLKNILNNYTPYESSDFENYWTTFTINNDIQISNNVVGTLMNLDIIKNDIYSRFSSAKLLNNIIDNFIQIVSDYFIEILNLNEKSNVSIDTLLQIGVDYLHILKHIDKFNDLNISNVENDNNLIMKFFNKVWTIGFNRNTDDFNQYYNEICKYI